MTKAIPDGLTEQHVLLALKDLDDKVEHDFGGPTGYQLTHEGKIYPPKAVVGIAFKHFTGDILHHSEFSGGEGSGNAIKKSIEKAANGIPQTFYLQR